MKVNFIRGKGGADLPPPHRVQRPLPRVVHAADLRVEIHFSSLVMWGFLWNPHLQRCEWQRFPIPSTSFFVFDENEKKSWILRNDEDDLDSAIFAADMSGAKVHRRWKKSIRPPSELVQGDPHLAGHRFEIWRWYPENTNVVQTKVKRVMAFQSWESFFSAVWTVP